MKTKIKRSKKEIAKTVLIIVAVAILAFMTIISESNTVRKFRINSLSNNILNDFNGSTNSDLKDFESRNFCREAGVKFQRSYEFCISEHSSSLYNSATKFNESVDVYNYFDKDWKIRQTEQESLKSKIKDEEVTYSGKKSFYGNVNCSVWYSYHTSTKYESLRISCSFRKSSAFL